MLSPFLRLEIDIDTLPITMPYRSGRNMEIDMKLAGLIAIIISCIVYTALGGSGFTTAIALVLGVAAVAAYFMRDKHEIATKAWKWLKS